MLCMLKTSLDVVGFDAVFVKFKLHYFYLCGVELYMQFELAGLSVLIFSLFVCWVVIFIFGGGLCFSRFFCV